MKPRKLLFIAGLLWFIPGGSTTAFSQKVVVQNLNGYEKEWLHFGFTLGLNYSTFITDYTPNFRKFDSLKVVEIQRKPGFNLGIISELRMTDYLTLRFVPDLAFIERQINYHFEGKKDTVIWEKKVESTLVEFPLHIKLRSKPYKNIGTYIITGGKYCIDLASKKAVPEETSDLKKQNVKLKKNDIAFDLGAGTEFYLTYFKFAVELKLSVGTRNLLIQENTLFSNPLERLRSKVWLISFTFEG